MNRSNLVVAALLALACPAAQGAQEALLPVYAAALSGDGVKALAELSKVDDSVLDAKEASRARCIREALVAPPKDEALPPLAGALLHAYRAYWQESLMQRVPREEAQARLKRRIDAVLTQWHAGTAPSASLDAASEQARRAIESEGLYALTGVTAPYYELAIWREQVPRNYTVELHDRSVTTRVIFLDGFVSFGWAGFATCNRAHTGGWATKTELFAVKSAYDVDSEAFRVSYLAHEARHFSDYGRFPKLEQPDLEYRAKLTELSLAEATAQGLVIGFARANGGDRTVPHDFAAHRVARDMAGKVFGAEAATAGADRWERVSSQDIRAAARRLLASSDATLARRDAASVARFLDD